MCPACHSKNAVLLGFLGLLKWFRCRDCGTDYSRQVRQRPLRQPWERK